jgi:hypothetical protein
MNAVRPDFSVGRDANRSGKARMALLQTSSIAQQLGSASQFRPVTRRSHMKIAVHRRRWIGTSIANSREDAGLPTGIEVLL